jgi:hypothetical protein
MEDLFLAAGSWSPDWHGTSDENSAFVGLVEDRSKGVGVDGRLPLVEAGLSLAIPRLVLKINMPYYDHLPVAFPPCQFVQLHMLLAHVCLDLSPECGDTRGCLVSPGHAEFADLVEKVVASLALPRWARFYFRAGSSRTPSDISSFLS